MSIQDRDYYKERELFKEQKRDKRNLLVWVIVVLVVLSLILSSLKF